MPIFSVADRKNIMDYIISFTEQNEHIVALVAVGSGSYGYIDELSDLDMVIALDSDENMEAVMDYVSSQLNNKLDEWIQSFLRAEDGDMPNPNFGLADGLLLEEREYFRPVSIPLSEFKTVRIEKDILDENETLLINS